MTVLPSQSAQWQNIYFNIFSGKNKGCHRGCHVLESQSKEMRSCSFPFIYADKTYKTCTDVDVSLV